MIDFRKAKLQQQKIRECEETIQVLLTKNKQYEERILELHNENIELDRNHRKLLTTCGEYKHRSKELMSDNEVFQTRLQNIEQERTQTIDKLELENNILNQKVQKLQNEIEKLTGVTATIETIRVDKKEIEQQLTESKKKEEDLKKELNSLNNKNEQLINEIDEINIENQTLQLTITNYMEEIKQIKEINKGGFDNNSNIQKQMPIITLDQSIQTNFDISNQDINNNSNKSNNNNNDNILKVNSDKINKLKSTISGLEQEKGQLQLKLYQADQQFDKYSRKTREYTDKLQEKIITIEQERYHLQVEVSTVRNQLSDLTTLVSQLENQIYQEKQKLNEIEQHVCN